MLTYCIIIYFLIVSLFMALLLKIICRIKQEVVDTREGCSSGGKVHYEVDRNVLRTTLYAR
jgi:predicted secreted protein